MLARIPVLRKRAEKNSTLFHTILQMKTLIQNQSTELHQAAIQPQPGRINVMPLQKAGRDAEEWSKTDTIAGSMEDR